MSDTGTVTTSIFQSMILPLYFFPKLGPPLFSDNGIRDDPRDLLGGGEIGGEPVLRHGPRDTCRCVGACVASTDPSHSEHGRRLLRGATDAADGVAQRPCGGEAHDLVDAAERCGGDLSQPPGRD